MDAIQTVLLFFGQCFDSGGHSFLAQTMSYGCGTLAGPGGPGSLDHSDELTQSPSKRSCDHFCDQLFLEVEKAAVSPSRTFGSRFNLGIAAASRSNGKWGIQRSGNRIREIDGNFTTVSSKIQAIFLWDTVLLSNSLSYKSLLRSYCKGLRP